MTINLKQAIAITIAILGVLMISTAQLTDLLGAGPAKTITSLAALLNTMLGAVMAVISSTYQTVKDASNTTGVEPLRINADASPALAGLALDPKVDNVAPKMSDRAAVEAKAGA